MNKAEKTAPFKLTALVLTIVLLISCVSFSAYAERDFQQEIDLLESKINENMKKKDDSNKTLDELNDEVAQLQQQIDLYNAQIGELNTQIAEKDAVINQFESEIAKLDEEINETNIKIDKLKAKISETYDLLAQRMRASYMAGETSTLEILLGASDFESFLTRLELLSAVARHDNMLVEDLNDQIKQSDELVEELNSKKAEQEEKKASIESERAVIVEKRAQIQAARNAVDAKQTTIEKKVQTQNNILMKLDKSSAAYRAQIEKIKKEQAEYDALKSQGMAGGSGSIGGGGGTSVIGNYPVSSHGMIGPLQYSNAYISQHYGRNGHKGVDICTRGTGSTMGKEIRAVADGVVYSAESHYSWGLNVYINHGNGVYTRYAHCSRMIVSAGQSVQQGQVIAYVGNTGNSFGAHLHFEVWVNGTRVNPEPWIPSLPGQ